MNDKQAMVEKLKTIELPLGILKQKYPELYQELLKYEGTEHIQFYSHRGMWVSHRDVFGDSFAHRLSPDFHLPAERWFYCNKKRTISDDETCGDKSICEGCVEIPAEDVEYVEGLIKLLGDGLGKYEFRKVKDGDFVLRRDGVEFEKDPMHVTEYAFVRKPAKEPRFVEYPITVRAGKYYECAVPHIPDICSLFELPSIVGFAGIKYRKGDGTETNFRDRCVFTQGGKEPATPIAARFYVKESK